MANLQGEIAQRCHNRHGSNNLTDRSDCVPIHEFVSTGAAARIAPIRAALDGGFRQEGVTGSLSAEMLDIACPLCQIVDQLGGS
jgi:hypothetical protein